MCRVVYVLRVMLMAVHGVLLFVRLQLQPCWLLTLSRPCLREQQCDRACRHGYSSAETATLLVRGGCVVSGGGAAESDGGGGGESVSVCGYRADLCVCVSCVCACVCFQEQHRL